MSEQKFNQEGTQVIYINLIEGYGQYGFMLIDAATDEALASRTYLHEEMRDNIASIWSTALRVPIVRNGNSVDKPNLSNVLYLPKKK